QIEETQNYNKNQDYYQAEIYQSDSFNVYYDNVKNIIEEITATPHIFRITENAEKNKFPTYLQVHSLALHLQEKYKREISWTWNIGWLENPNQYTLIGCENEQSFAWNQKSKNVSTSLGQEISLPENQESVQKTYTNILKKAIHKIAENKETNRNLDILINELKVSDSVHQWEWRKLIDRTWYEASNESEKVIYKSLVLLLNPNLKIDEIDINPLSWIESLKPSSDTQKKNQKLPVNRYAENGIKVQDQLLMYIYQHPKIKDQLIARIYQIIIELLLDLSTSEENYQVIEWLFLNYPKFWQCYLVNYANVLFKNLDNYQRKEKVSKEIEDKFLVKIIEDLKLMEERKQRIQFLDYQPIAEFFETMKAYSLSAFFYQLSIGYVPSSLRNKCSVLPEIIPLKEKKYKKETTEKNIGKKAKMDLLDFKNIGLIYAITSGILIGISIGILLGIPIQKWFRGYDKILYSPISKNKSEIIPSSPTHELYLYVNLLETGYLNKDIQQKYIENLGALINQIPKSNNENYKNETSRKEIINNREELTSLPLYKFIEEFTPPVNPKISRSYTTDDIYSYSYFFFPLTSPEIKQAKNFLKGSLGIYQGEINDIWDQETSDAVKKFQNIYKITPDDGNLGADTWSILSIMIQHRQIKQAAQKLKLIIEQSNNYDQFKTKYNKLNECKQTTDQLYSDCLKERFKNP
nr:peptidoglycan-binding domain-containing protein [Crocosphaera sp.]